MRIAQKRTTKAFSLIELVIVIIIMGVISAIAIPRMMQGADNADVTGLQSDLAVMRGAIEMYRYEHSAFPLAANFAVQLTQETDDTGAADPAGGYGPYVVKIPPLKTGTHKGQSDVMGVVGTPAAEDAGATIGWLYDEATGSIWANDADHLDL